MPASTKNAGRRAAAPAASTRQLEIIDGTLRAVARHGFAGASMRNIAAEVGCTTGAVMHHFGDKDALLSAVAEEVFRPFDELIEQARKRDDTWDALLEVCTAPLPTTRSKRRIPRGYVVLLISAESHPGLAAVCRKRYGAIRQGIRDLLEKGQANGTITPDIDPVAQTDLLCAMVDGLAINAISEPRRFPAARLIELVTGELDRLRGPGSHAAASLAAGT